MSQTQIYFLHLVKILILTVGYCLFFLLLISFHDDVCFSISKSCCLVVSQIRLLGHKVVVTVAAFGQLLQINAAMVARANSHYSAQQKSRLSGRIRK